MENQIQNPQIQAQESNKVNGKANQTKIDYSELLNLAVTEKGVINAAYSAFHDYSIGNQMFAASQLIKKDLKLTPIASYKAWKEKGRQVIKGQKAIALCMPITFTSKSEVNNNEAEGVTEEYKRTMFRVSHNWFSYEQTEGEEYAPEIKIPSWNAELAMQNLNIEEIPFERLRGNVLGYATERKIAINPMNNLKHKTRFHEMAHIVLGHTVEEDLTETEILPQDLREAEAEGVAFILTSILDLDGQAESRAYIQGWLQGKEIPEENAKRIFVAANKIMQAGQNATV